jgi:hypothetical protein
MEKYPYIQRAIEEGLNVSFNDTGMGKRLTIVCDEGGQLVMFASGKMKYEKMMTKLNGHLEELFEDGIANDEINGSRYKIW